MNLFLMIQTQFMAQADSIGAVDQATELAIPIIELTLKGGWIMIPIALLSILAIYIFVERYFAIRKAGQEDTHFMNRIKEFIHEGKIDAAIRLAQATNTPVSRMIEAGIRRIGRPMNDVNAAIENVGKLEVYQLERGLPTLATSAGAAPMIGFLGTVIGMIRAFWDMSNAGSNIDVGLLSNGIYTAMVTTAAGLFVGIIAYFCYNILVAKIDKVVFLLEARSSEFMDLLNEPVK
ncbi:MAG: MotA/TolQ/ExbB proton channel family protein [Bacteroidetes bacterium]|jgi:biopolymer transport protein ExbB|nr:MotA/TolQ/ExbB proton channel family protein [Bacteroidota bacterium]MBT3749972.1 MotA/TolQ/ExbB proton channel family protein [Bacteroidota bacterium]MBT4410269.1 MotA/TolQ/ExbB proton channel family protein [Bacteroidota bacterium]MBT5427832.1 MotA/TolQ/ExbB proton channel family protein [Bacteroidota bacterium]MBT7093820.1 MotA/TolQ/ExbB proton channel family protein [Bacteroidota bacterium]